MKIWVNSNFAPPAEYFWCRNLEDFKLLIENTEEYNTIPHFFNVTHEIDFIDVSEELFEEVDGWLIKTKKYYPLYTHSIIKT